MSLEAWQTELRRQFDAEQRFLLKNVGREPIFSEYLVANPKSCNTYRVVIRGESPGVNYCSCPDFATNTLGTCKHVEFTLARLRSRRDGKKALADGFRPTFSEVCVRYGAERCITFRPAVDCPPALGRLAAKYFGSDGALLPESFARFDKFLAEVAKIDHEVRVYDDALDLAAQVRDGDVGGGYMKIPLPPADVLQPALQALATALARWQR